MIQKNVFEIENSSVNNVHIAGSKYAFPFTFAFALLFILSGFSNIFAQEQIDYRSAEPPPLKIVSKGERAQLDVQPEVKKRTKLALDLMEGRLKKAEMLFAQEQYKEMFLELGHFHGLIENTMMFLKTTSGSEDKVLNNFKRLEIGIRAFMPRLEVIRRDLPERYDPYVKSLVRALRDARAKAVEPLFGNTVVPNRN